MSRSQAPLGNAYLQALLDVVIKLSIFCSCYTKQSLVIVTPKLEFGSETSKQVARMELEECGAFRDDATVPRVPLRSTRATKLH